jgi:pimeloyl-ACP methyl ester carboxylesterase
VLDELSVDRASLVGISLGGWLATQVAIRRADRLNRLVLLSPSGIGRQKTGTLLIALAILPFGRWGRELAMRRVLGTQLSGTAAAEYVL